MSSSSIDCVPKVHSSHHIINKGVCLRDSSKKKKTMMKKHEQRFFFSQHTKKPHITHFILQSFASIRLFNLHCMSMGNFYNVL